jgi:hypothetical protein
MSETEEYAKTPRSTVHRYKQRGSCPTPATPDVRSMYLLPFRPSSRVRPCHSACYHRRCACRPCILQPIAPRRRPIPDHPAHDRMHGLLHRARRCRDVRSGHLPPRPRRLAPHVPPRHPVGRPAHRRTARRPPVCVAATLFDGVVLALTPFNHSCNFRSAVVHG